MIGWKADELHQDIRRCSIQLIHTKIFRSYDINFYCTFIYAFTLRLDNSFGEKRKKGRGRREGRKGTEIEGKKLLLIRREGRKRKKDESFPSKSFQLWMH